MSKGGFDVNGAWHDPGDGKFAKKGMSTAKAAVLALVRGALAAGHAKRDPDGIDLKLRRPAGVHKPGDVLRARYHNDTHATVDMGGRPALVRWDTFEEPDPIEHPVTQDLVERKPDDIPTLPKLEPVRPRPDVVQARQTGGVETGDRETGDRETGDRETVTVPDHVIDAAERAIDDLTDIYVEDVGVNAALLDTIPTIPTDVGELSPAAQLIALDWLFHPKNPPAPLAGLPVLDATEATNLGPRPKLGMVAVNPDSGAIIGTFAPWDEAGSLLPPYGEWVSLPADHPAAARLVTAAWLATPAVKRHIVGNVYEPGMLPHLRAGGEFPDDHPFPGLIDAYREQSNSVIGELTGVVTLDKHTDKDGSWFTPSKDGLFSADTSDIRFADLDETGRPRLWIDPAGITEPDDTAPLRELDYSDADNESLPWADRIKALKKVHAELKSVLSGTPDDWLTIPHETDVAALIEGHGGEQELARVAAVERFGKSVSALVDTRIENPAVDKQPVLGPLTNIPGVPPELVSLLETEDWVNPVHVNVPGTKSMPGGGHTVIRFADHPDSSVVVLTPADGSPVQVAWAFDPKDRAKLPGRFDGWDPNHTITADRDSIPEQFHSPTVQPRVDHAEPSATLTAFTETMEALGIDMGVDPDIYVGSGRNRAAEARFYGAVDANPTKLSDLDPDSELAETVNIGLAPFPKAWTSQLRRKLQRLSIDQDRTAPMGQATKFSDANLLDIPSIVLHPEFKDVVTHEFTHSMEHTVAGLITAETWHFIQRLRKEHATTGENKRWDNQMGRGYADEFGDQYMGRLYTTDLTNQRAGYELLSTASQQLHGHTHRARFGMDKPGRDFLIGLMSIVDPDPPEDMWNP